MTDRLTLYDIEEIACPKCGHKHSKRKYKRINVTQKQELKEDILKNRLFSFACDACHFTAPLTYESLYLDSKKKLSLYLAPVMTSEVEEDIRRLDKELRGTKRIVDNINDLKEKILIEEMKFDDRVIELIKILYIGQIKEEMKDDTMLDILFDYAGSEPCFLVFFEKKGIGRMPLNLEYYRGISAQYSDQIRRYSSDTFMKVDMEWAGQILFKKPKIQPN